MNRRRFLKKSVAATTVIMGSGLMLSSCKKNLRSELMGIDRLSDKSDQMDHDVYKILYYASLAPSGHNSQPWFVKIISKTQWIVGADADRRLSQVDGSNREAMLSLGAFIENLVQAANAFGYAVETKVIAKDRFAADVVKINLLKSKVLEIPLQRILTRRTVKSHFQSKELRLSDVNDFFQSVDGHLFYFPTGTDHAKLMDKEAVDNYIIQSNNINAMEELAFWIRFKDDDAKKFRDGLTVDGMEITGLAGWYVRNFMDNKDVMTQSFSDKGIEKTKEQVKEGAGWLVITSDGNTVKDLIETGRRFQRMALTAREKMIGIHPMTQALEEKQGQKNITENHEASMIPQFMLRVGYLDKYPDPVSLRRPVEWFVRS
ncbi:MAG: nitroreductase [Deltaproteobacteria bacterium]|nr:nitroreductase [Deltaproteobacteria bacterium]